ncbi:hypothetical protein D3C87_1752920 [compost metagenome]
MRAQARPGLKLALSRRLRPAQATTRPHSRVTMVALNATISVLLKPLISWSETPPTRCRRLEVSTTRYTAGAMNPIRTGIQPSTTANAAATPCSRRGCIGRMRCVFA